MSYPYPRLENKIVCVTGASAGIGECTAKLFAECGAHLILLARRKDKLERVQKEIQTTNPKCKIHLIAASVIDKEQLKNAFSSLPEFFQNIDILVNNAGKALENKHASDHDLVQVEEMLDTNIKSVFYILSLVLPSMKKRNSGFIVNVGSVAGLEGYVGGSAYCASKFAVEGLTEALRKEVVEYQIRVSCVNPALTETEFSLVRFGNDEDRAKKVYEGLTPLVGQDIADNICYITSRPPHVQISNLVVYPTNQAACTMVHRTNKN